MRVGIIGAGALGSLFGAKLLRAGHSVWFLENHPERLRLRQKFGLRISGLTNIFIPGKRFLGSTRAQELPPVEVLFFFVKAYDTRRAARQTIPWVRNSPTVFVVTLQNGLGNAEALASVIKTPILAGATSQAATAPSPMRLVHTGKGGTLISNYCCGPRPLLKVVGLLNSAGIPSQSRCDARSILWSKLVLNAAINPLAALVRRKNGELLRSGPWMEILEAAVAEGSRVAESLGIPLLYKEPAAAMRDTLSQTSPNKNSMWMDVLKGRRTEAPWILGPVLREAARRRVSCPTLSFLYKKGRFQFFKKLNGTV